MLFFSCLGSNLFVLPHPHLLPGLVLMNGDVWNWNVSGRRLWLVCAATHSRVYLKFSSGHLNMWRRITYRCSGFQNILVAKVSPPMAFSLFSFSLTHWDFAIAVCLGSLSCWKVNLCPSLKFLQDSNVFTKRFSIFCTVPLSFNSDQFFSSSWWGISPYHDATSTMLHLFYTKKGASFYLKLVSQLNF